jgi:hypothetical protein
MHACRFTHTNPGYWQSVQPIHILHFSSSPKPWDVANGAGDKKPGMGDLEYQWMLALMASKAATA